MKYDDVINIAVGAKADSKRWKNTKMKWSAFVDLIAVERKTTETYKQYITSSKDDQSAIKDVGAYFGGYLRSSRRLLKNVENKRLITLDIDFAHVNFWEDFKMQFNNAALIHGTHKHSVNTPRYRLILPLSREVSPDEYLAISRQIAGIMDIDLFDPTTFEVNRCMFWPSISKDMEYYFEKQDGPFLDADKILDTYLDWKDSTLWPTSSKDYDIVKNKVDKQQDPEEKRGIVGLFCRSFSVIEAIEKFLPDEYEAKGENRFTYTQGSTAGGLIIYDDKFAYSHHGSDPCSGKLCNSFDLVRIHKYGHLDSGKTQNGKLKSFTEMEEFARSIKEVKRIIASEKLSEAQYDFSNLDLQDVDDENQEEKEVDISWMEDLELDQRNRYLSSANNINLIFLNDSILRDAFKENNFDNKRYIFKSMPWRKIKQPETVKNVDYSGVRNYIESVYGIAGTMKIEDCMSLQFEKNSFHPIKDYLNSLKWDGQKRIDTLLIDYFGSEDTLYTREAIRKMLVGAVGRVFVPGIKFDLVLTLSGEQGTFKSTFVSKLGKEWFSDTFMTVQGKEALEQIQGAWIIEMAELSGLRKAEVEATKHFISKQEDSFRPAYARASEVYKRQCVFFGTTNKKDFLKDATGNRRFLPIDVNEKDTTKSVVNDLTESEIDQIWAEAVELFKLNEPLFLSPKAEKQAKNEQKKHSENDERKGLVEYYLDTKLPKNWDEKDVFQRRQFIEGDESIGEKGTVTREFVCVAEIWCECLGKNKEDMDRYKTRDLNDILRSLDGWEQSKSTKNFKLYGKQKYYSRQFS